MSDSLYVLLWFALCMTCLFLYRSFSLNRRERDVRACCRECSPSLEVPGSLTGEGVSATARLSTRAKGRPSNPAVSRHGLAREAAGTS